MEQSLKAGCGIMQVNATYTSILTQWSLPGNRTLHEVIVSCLLMHTIHKKLAVFGAWSRLI